MGDLPVPQLRCVVLTVSLCSPVYLEQVSERNVVVGLLCGLVVDAQASLNKV